MEQFDIEYQWAFYLKLVKLDPSTMSLIQLIETKRAFVAGMAQFIALAVKDEDDDLSEAGVQKLVHQIENYWTSETKSNG